MRNEDLKRGMEVRVEHDGKLRRGKVIDAQRELKVKGPRQWKTILGWKVALAPTGLPVIVPASKIHPADERGA